MSTAWRRRILFLSAFLLIVWVVWDINQREANLQTTSKPREGARLESSFKRSPNARPDRGVPVVPHDAGSLRIPSRQEYVTPVPDLFEIPKPPEAKPVVREPEAQTAPPLPFIYLGRFDDGSNKQIFFADGNATIAAGAGARLAGGWTLESIETGRLIFLYEPLGQKQSLQVREY